MTTLAERLNKESKSGKGISEELFLSEMKKLSTLIINSFEKQATLLATIGNEAKAREDKIVSLLSANERLLININKVFLQSNNGDNTRKESVSSNIGNDESGKPSSNGTDSKVSRAIAFNVDTFKQAYIYRLPEMLEKAVNEFISQLNSPCSTIEIFQTMFEVWVKANPNYDIRKIVPGIAKKAFWQSMEKAISFNAAKPVKHTLTSEDNKPKDKSDFISLLSILDENGISKETLNNVIAKVKPHITKSDFSDKALLDNDLFQEICSMLGFTTNNAAKWSKVKIYLSRLLSC